MDKTKLCYFYKKLCIYCIDNICNYWEHDSPHTKEVAYCPQESLKRSEANRIKWSNATILSVPIVINEGPHKDPKITFGPFNGIKKGLE